MSTVGSAQVKRVGTILIVVLWWASKTDTDVLERRKRLEDTLNYARAETHQKGRRWQLRALSCLSRGQSAPSPKVSQHFSPVLPIRFRFYIVT
jgi:hypothetical protein